MMGEAGKTGKNDPPPELIVATGAMGAILGGAVGGIWWALHVLCGVPWTGGEQIVATTVLGFALGLIVGFVVVCCQLAGSDGHGS